MTPIVHVFAGPSLPRGCRPKADHLVYHEPAEQGSVYALVSQRPRAIALIDGYFERVPAVWHKELLFALSSGIAVYGCSSMGALRAVELADFGMRGVGQVYTAFAEGRLSDDDEVTIVHGSAENDYRPGSEAMVNVRATLVDAVTQGVIDHTIHDALVAHVKALYYPDRSYSAVLAWAYRNMDTAAVQRLRDWLRAPGSRRDVKREDAQLLLAVLAEPESIEAPLASWQFNHTDAWETVRRGFVQANTDDPATLPPQEQALLRILRADPASFSSLELCARLRTLDIDAARLDGFVPDEQDHAAALAELCSARGLHDREQLERWMQTQNLDEHGLEKLVYDEACSRHTRMRQSQSSARQLIDFLKVSGLYAPPQQPSGSARLARCAPSTSRGERNAAE